MHWTFTFHVYINTIKVTIKYLSLQSLQSHSISTLSPKSLWYLWSENLSVHLFYLHSERWSTSLALCLSTTPTPHGPLLPDKGPSKYPEQRRRGVWVSERDREKSRERETGRGKERDGVPGSAYKKRGGHLDHRQQEWGEARRLYPYNQHPNSLNTCTHHNRGASFMQKHRRHTAVFSPHIHEKTH